MQNPVDTERNRLREAMAAIRIDCTIALLVAAFALTPLALGSARAIDSPAESAPPSENRANSSFGTGDRLAHLQNVAPHSSSAPSELPAPPGGDANRQMLVKEAQSSMTPVDVLPPSEVYILSLGDALTIAQQQNPGIGIARQAVVQALAANLQARVLWLPNLNAGTNYHLHNGVLQTSFGLIRRLQEQSIYVGGGARTLAAETIGIPMVQFLFHVGDAIYSPEATRQAIFARRWDYMATRNTTLLEVSQRYLELLRAETQVEALRRSQADMHEIVRTTAAFAAAGRGREGDFRRAKSDSLLVQLDEQRAQEQVGVAAAELARVLHLDPSIRLTTVKEPIGIVELIDPDANLPQLLQTALSRRPELGGRNFDISSANVRVRQEETRAMLPTLALGFSTGGFGGGSNQTALGVDSLFQRFGTRTDFDLLAYWHVQNFGAGNIALTRQRRAERTQLVYLRAQTVNDIRAQVAEAYAEMREKLIEVQVAIRQLQTARRGVQEEIRRTRAGEGLPIEALNSVKLLKTARVEVVDAIIAYDLAQFDLFVALGNVPTPRAPAPTVNRSVPLAPVAAPRSQPRR